MQDALIWLGILLCMSQSALFSGSNLAVFSLSRLRLETSAAEGDANAIRALDLRRDANLTLVTILIGNVSVNVLLTLLSDSVLTGVAAFLFSTVVITAAGEIAPQAILSRHALKSMRFVSPALRLYRIALWPLSKPIARLLDATVGPEAIPWFRERELEDILRHQGKMGQSEVGNAEAIGAVNFIRLDDLRLEEASRSLNPNSVIAVPFKEGRPVFSDVPGSAGDPFAARLRQSQERWIVLTDPEGEPRLLLDTHTYFRAAATQDQAPAPENHCRRPLIARDACDTMDWVFQQLQGRGKDPDGFPPVLVWTKDQRRLITARDLLSHLFKGVV